MWACRRRFPTIINAHNQCGSLSLSLSSWQLLKKLWVRARPFDTRARIKRIDAGIRDPQASIVSPSTLFCPSSGQAPRVISRIGRALCAAFRARKRFVICASVVYRGCAGRFSPSGYIILAARSRDSATRPGVLGSKLLQHPEISHSCRGPRAGRTMAGVALFRAAFSTAAASLSLNEGTLSPTAWRGNGDRNLVCETVFEVGGRQSLCLIK